MADSEDWLSEGIESVGRIRSDEEQKAAATYLAMREQQGSRAASDNNLARWSGLPADTVGRNRTAVESRMRAARELRIIGEVPGLHRWLGEPRNAAAAQGDVENLGAVSAWFGPRSTVADTVVRGGRGPSARQTFAEILAPRSARDVIRSARVRSIEEAQTAEAIERNRPNATAGSVWTGLGVDTVEGFKQSWYGSALYMADAIGATEVVDDYTKAFQQSQQRATAYRPNIQSTLGSAVYGGGASLLQMVPALVVGAFTGGVGAVTTIGLQVGTGSYGKYRARGATANQALAGGVLEGGIEAVTEAVPMGFLFSSIGKKGTAGLVAGYLGREVLTEQLATLGQDAVDTAIANPTATWDQYWADRPMAAFNTAVATLVSTGAVGVGSALYRSLKDTSRDLNEATTAIAGARFLDQSMHLAETTALRENDPQGFREFVAGQAEGSPVENVYVPAEAVRSLFQDGSYDQDAFWSGFSAQIEQAEAIGGDIVVPIADFMTGVAGTDQWATLRDSVRLSPGGMSLAEARSIQQSYMDLMQERGAEIAAVEASTREEQAPARKVYETVLDQARAAGFSLNSARAYAELFAARYATRAAQRGTDAFSLFSESVGGIVAELPEGLRSYAPTDRADVLINAMRRGKAAPSERAVKGKSLLEFIAGRGGAEDPGGDLTSMGARDWHRGAKFRKKLVRESSADASLPGMAVRSSPNSLDALAEAAWDAGYFPNSTERPDIVELLEAMEQELRGSPVHAVEGGRASAEADQSIRTAADELRGWLQTKGLDPEVATNEQIRGALKQGEVEAKRSLEQGGTRGRIDFDKDGKALIRLFEGRDLSTLLHESGHLWLEELRVDASAKGAPEQVKEDWKAIERWFTANGHKVKKTIPTEAHEMWARGMERYFMEGKAPTTALQRAFSSFRAWLLRIYHLVASLNTPLTDEVRDVMGRMLATQEAIDDAVSRPESGILFKDAASAGMTDAEFAAYRASVDATRTEAFDALLFRTMETVRRSRTAEWKQQRVGVKAEIEKEVLARPEFKALDLLRGRGGERVQLSREAIVADFGSDMLALLPRGVPPTVIDKGGVHPDILAERVGFRTGAEMLEMLAGVEQRQRELRADGDKRTVYQETVDLGTDQAMRERHGDILSDGTIEEEALAAIHNDQRATVIAAEVRALSRKASTVAGSAVPTPWKLAREWAEGVVRTGTVAEQASAAALARHNRNEGKAQRAAEKAMLAGTVDEAFRQKQSQLYHHALYRAAKDAKDEVDKIVKRLGKLAKAKQLDSMDGEYLERIHDLLEAYDFKPRSARERQERASFFEWARGKEEAGEEIVTPARLLTGVNFKDLTVDDLTGLDDAVQSLAHLGRRKKKLLLAKEERELEEVVAEALAAAESHKSRPASALRNEPKGARAELRGLDAAFRKMEFVADELDRYNPNGAFNRLLVQGANEAANRKEALVDQVLRPLVETYNGMSKEQQRWMLQKVTVPELVTRNPDTGVEEPTVFLRSELLAMALNVGNESNLDKLLRGESLAVSERNAWTEEKVQAVLDREMTEEDWRFVEKVWAQIETLWPDIVTAEREITGVAPEKVEPRVVETKFGPIQGGYYPVVFDPTRSTWAAANYEDDAAKMLGQMGRAVSTPKGHTISRTAAAAPLLLSLEGVLLNHVNRVTTRIAYGRYVRDVLKFTNHPKIRDMVSRKMGPEYHRLFKSWLQRQVNDAAFDTRQLAGAERWMRKFRVNATIVGLGFRFTTMLAQTAGLLNGASRIGPKWMLVGMGETAKHMGGLREFVFSRSAEMAGRAQSFDRDVRTFFTDLSGERSKLDPLRAWAFWGIGNIQLFVVDMPTWLGAYNKALSEGMTEDEAVAYSDKMVRMTQSAGRTKDLSEIQDASEFARTMTLFYSYFSVLYNAQRETLHLARHGDMRRAGMNVMFVMMLGPLAAALLTGDWPNDEESWTHWATRKMFFGLWLGVPGVRDVAAGADRFFAGKNTYATEAPFYRAFTELGKAMGEGYKVAAGGDPSDRWLQNAITAPGYFVGLPTGQAGATAQYLYDVAIGTQNPEDARDVAAGIIKGPREDQE